MTDRTRMDRAVQNLRKLGAASPVSSMNGAEAEWREASKLYVEQWNANPANPRIF